MRSTWTTLGVLALACPALAGGDGSIKIAPVEGQEIEREVPKGVSRVDGGEPIRPRRLQPGQVLFHLEDADLATEVLPLFEQQAGIKLGVQADSRPVTLRLTQPVDWEVALDLICEFADVHVTKTHDGEVVVRNDYGGELGERHEWADIAGSLDAESMRALDNRRRDAQRKRAANYSKIRARQRNYNQKARFNGTAARGGFGWQGGTARGQYSRGQHSQGVYARAPRQRAQYSRGQYSRGQQARGQYSRGQRTRGVVSRGQYSRGQPSRGLYNRGQQSRGQPSRGQYSRGSHSTGGR